MSISSSCCGAFFDILFCRFYFFRKIYKTHSFTVGFFINLFPALQYGIEARRAMQRKSGSLLLPLDRFHNRDNADYGILVRIKIGDQIGNIPLGGGVVDAGEASRSKKAGPVFASPINAVPVMFQPCGHENFPFRLVVAAQLRQRPVRRRKMDEARGHGRRTPPAVPATMFFQSVSPLKKAEREAAAQRRPAKSERKNRIVFAKRRIAGFETQRVANRNSSRTRQ